ncbi:MAG: type II/IV secretion system protein [Cellvibrionales bacterium]|nr:type II/IV secretion system protein [Cellvibrionales bacterium]
MPDPAHLKSAAAIAAALCADGRISEADRQRLQRTPLSGGHPIAAIAALELPDLHHRGRVLTGEVLGQWWAEQLGVPYYSINPLRVNVQAVTAVMSFNYAKRHRILCVEVRPDAVVIGAADPQVRGWQPAVEQTTRKPVRTVFVRPDLLDKYTIEFYSIARSVSGADARGDSGSRVTNFEQLVDLKSDKEAGAEDQHIVNIVDWLLQYAFSQRASDIHLEPARELGKVRFRIDGVLHDVYEMPRNVAGAVTARLKVLGRMDVAEKRRPQDGRIKTRNPEGREVELRLSTLPTAFGEKLVLRIFDPEVLLRSFEQMGLEEADLRAWRSLTTRSSGIALVTGPTGSGKTTTLYTTLRELATAEVNVSTLEDPIEMVVDSLNQTQVQPQIDLNFAAGIRTLLRQDPDIIMVGEIRDRETADMAVQAALTGHLVLSTLHTNDAPTAITRLLDLGLPAHLIRVTLNGVMAQRLVRTLCPHCRAPIEVEREAWQTLIAPFKQPPPEKLYRPGGCLECRNTGYMGREGIYEIMHPSTALRRLITEQTDLEKVRRQSLQDGNLTLRLAGAKKVAAGRTTIEEVLRVTPVAE